MSSIHWPLGTSAAWRELNGRAPREATVTLVALYALALLPFAFIFKRWAVEILSIAIGLMFLYQSHRTKNWQWLREWPVRIALGLWTYVLLIVTPLADDPMTSLSRALIWGRHILFFAAVVYWLFNYTEEMKRIAFLMAFILCAVTIDTYIQYITGESLTGRLKPEHRLTGPMTKLVIGIYLAKLSFPILGLLLYHAWQDYRRRGAAICFTLVTIMMAAICLSNERTALISYLIGLGGSAALLFWFLKPARLLVAGFSVLQLVVLVSLYATQPELQIRISQSMQQMGGFEGSPYGQLWKGSYELWKRNPITGVGLMNFRSSCPELIKENVVDYCDLHSHNVYLEWLAEAGIIGFAGIIALVISLAAIILSRIRYAKPEDYILISFALAGLLPTFFPLAATQSFFSNWPAWLAWFSITLCVGMVQRIKPHG